MDTDLAERLARWRAAGLIDEPLATAIALFEATRPPPSPPDPAPGSTRISTGEIVAYAGIALASAGTVLAVERHFQTLGFGGRMALYGIVALGTAAAARQLWRGQASPAGRRAAVICLVLGLVATGAMVTETAARLGSSKAVMAAAGAAAMAALGALLLSWTRGTPLALVVAAAANVATFASMAAANVSQRAAVAAASLIPGTALLLLTRAPRLTGSTASEVLRLFGALVPIGTFYAMGGRGFLGLELLAGAWAAVALLLGARANSNGFAIAGGLGIFGFVVDIGSRYLSRTVGFPAVLILSGGTLVAIAIVLQRTIRHNRRAATAAP
ncbi:MAG TPA: DUF2157 domain-containing protein [Candidatus Dormibacteraeota bacterium]|nr:DUF2157 domain-containing protein [Candidatus Dormibacteraeota bacterium]